MACLDDPNVREVLPISREVIGYGLTAAAPWSAKNIEMSASGWAFDVFHEDTCWVSAHTHMIGRHNVSNAVACIAMAHALGLSAAEVKRGLETFKGVRRRQECVGEAQGVVIYDDFAHHPTAVLETLRAFVPLSQHRQGRLLVVFEPRSNTSRRRIFQKRWPEAFALADQVFIAPVYIKKDSLSAADMLDPSEIVEDIVKSGGRAKSFSSNEALKDELLKIVKPGDVLVFMSNGLFEGLPRKTLAALAT